MIFLSPNTTIQDMKDHGFTIQKQGENYIATLGKHVEKLCTECGKERILVSGLTICQDCDAKLSSENKG